MKIIDKINNALAENEVFCSFEYFPPRTERGEYELFQRLEKMSKLKPLFIDITWGAGGSTSGKTIEICTRAQNRIGIDAQMHMTCVNMKKEDINKVLQIAKKNGIQNILALRGDPPMGTATFTPVEGGFTFAKDLVQHIRAMYGDYFGISAAGYPEGHPQGDYKSDLKFLKEKVDAGADFIITQLFYDCDSFLDFVKDCREIGIQCPILPGIMPIYKYSSFKKMTDFCKTKVPQCILDDLSKIDKDNDADVQAYGIKLAITMCRKLIDNGVKGLHFYTLNLQKSIVKIMEGLNLLPESIQRTLPWRVSANANRQKEEVRPIFWANRPESYLHRTCSWEDFPAGRWGSDTLHFDEIDDYRLLVGIASKELIEQRIKNWGNNHQSIESIQEVFIKYLRGETESLPWNETPLSKETDLIMERLIWLNKNGFLTINSQPRVNGAKSTDKAVGWGPARGYVYQKAYVEFFCSPQNLQKLAYAIKNYPLITYHAVNKNGDSYCNSEGVNAVTWGVFPGREIVQPTIVSKESFLAWKKEAFELWKVWQSLCTDRAKEVIQKIHDTYYLVNIVDNDFANDESNIFGIFDDIIEEKFEGNQ